MSDNVCTEMSCFLYPLNLSMIFCWLAMTNPLNLSMVSLTSYDKLVGEQTCRPRATKEKIVANQVLVHLYYHSMKTMLHTRWWDNQPQPEHLTVRKSLPHEKTWRYESETKAPQMAKQDLRQCKNEFVPYLDHWVWTNRQSTRRSCSWGPLGRPSSGMHLIR